MDAGVTFEDIEFVVHRTIRASLTQFCSCGCRERIGVGSLIDDTPYVWMLSL